MRRGARRAERGGAGHQGMADALPSTLTGFFRATDQAVRAYDLGRRVVRIAPRALGGFERAEEPYPWPLRRHAWIGLLLWQRGTRRDPYLWFLKLPLDEQGRLVQASRDYVLRRIYEAYGHRLRQGAGGGHHRDGPKRVLEDNPFAFRPDPVRLAVFRARSSVDLGLEPSRFHPLAHAYFTGRVEVGRWPEIGLQGIADVAARLARDPERAALTARVPGLPPEAFVALCTCLESVPVAADLARAIAARTERALAEQAPAPVVAAGVRGIARARARTVGGQLLDRILASPLGADIEVLAAVAGRAWELLEHRERRTRYLERLAASDAGQAGFDAIVSDLLFMPGLRETLLETLRDPACPARVAGRRNALFAAAAGSRRG